MGLAGAQLYKLPLRINRAHRTQHTLGLKFSRNRVRIGVAISPGESAAAGDLIQQRLKAGGSYPGQ